MSACVVVDVAGVPVIVHGDGPLDESARAALAELVAAARRRFVDEFEAERHAPPPAPLSPLELERRQCRAEILAGRRPRPPR